MWSYICGLCTYVVLRMWIVYLCDPTCGLCTCVILHVDCVCGPMGIVYVRTYVCDPTYVSGLCTYEHNIMQVACVHTFVHTCVSDW